VLIGFNGLQENNQKGVNIMEQHSLKANRIANWSWTQHLYLFGLMIFHLVHNQPRPYHLADMSYYHLSEIIRLTTARMVGR
jgi:hypothetical protein